MNSARGEHDSPAPTRPSTGWLWLSAAWVVALVSTFAALFIGEVIGMTPCQLCWYQRILMFPLAVILGMAAFGGDRRGAIYALPLALGGASGVMICSLSSTWLGSFQLTQTHYYRVCVDKKSTSSRKQESSN